MSYPFFNLATSLPGNTQNPDKRPGHGTAWYQRQVYEIKELLIHHAASVEDVTPNQINSLHHANGWWKASYAYMVSPDGTQYKINRTTDVTWHCPGHNRIGLSICFLGNRAVVPPPFDQWQSAVQLAADICRKVLIRVDRIHAHGEFWATQCPGRHIDVKGRFRADVAAALFRAPA